MTRIRIVHDQWKTKLIKTLEENVIVKQLLQISLRPDFVIPYFTVEYERFGLSKNTFQGQYGVEFMLNREAIAFTLKLYNKRTFDVFPVKEESVGRDSDHRRFPTTIRPLENGNYLITPQKGTMGKWPGIELGRLFEVSASQILFNDQIKIPIKTNGELGTPESILKILKED